MRAYTHRGAAHRQQVSTIFWLRKTWILFSCAPDRIRTSDHGIHWISRLMLYQTAILKATKKEFHPLLFSFFEWLRFQYNFFSVVYIYNICHVYSPNAPDLDNSPVFIIPKAGLFVCLLKAYSYSPANCTRSPQGFHPKGMLLSDNYCI